MAGPPGTASPRREGIRAEAVAVAADQRQPGVQGRGIGARTGGGEPRSPHICLGGEADLQFLRVRAEGPLYTARGGPCEGDRPGEPFRELVERYVSLALTVVEYRPRAARRPVRA
ncbi:hypothetical protein ACFUNF_35350 [Streptomyces sp. NPDC057291]|uniref:hypothetical protein n=1 Tax=Streptomyces sp. NPDC057291 TaxID=3346087 RepID=UPI0036272D76